MSGQWLILAADLRANRRVGLFLFLRKIDHRAARQTWPFDELKVRPAGESTRLVAAEWNEKLLSRMLLAVAVPAVMLVALGSQRAMGLVGLGIVLALTTALAIVTLRRTWQALEKWRSYNLGFEGERFVGAELDVLARHKFEVCHDVPFGKFNIDHVLVGPTGVYAVETKTRRKPKEAGRKTNWTVTVHEDAIEYPWGRDRFGLEQAMRNAQTLRKWILDATRETVEVHPVLALPGWMVDRKARNAVMVISARNAAQVFLKGRTVLSDEMIQRIAFQLREKSRIDFGN